MKKSTKNITLVILWIINIILAILMIFFTWIVNKYCNYDGFIRLAYSPYISQISYSCQHMMPITYIFGGTIALICFFILFLNFGVQEE